VVAAATGAYCGSDAVEASGGCGAGQRQSVPAADEKARSTFWQQRTLRLRWLPLCTLLPHTEPRHHELSSDARESTRRASTGSNGSIFTRLNGKRHRRSSRRWLKGRDKPGEEPWWRKTSGLGESGGKKAGPKAWSAPTKSHNRSEAMKRDASMGVSCAFQCRREKNHETFPCMPL
jgi:hypothetical protein